MFLVYGDRPVIHPTVSIGSPIISNTHRRPSDRLLVINQRPAIVIAGHTIPQRRDRQGSLGPTACSPARVSITSSVRSDTPEKPTESLSIYLLIEPTFFLSFALPTFVSPFDLLH
jgi:hypothetical protein